MIDKAFLSFLCGLLSAAILYGLLNTSFATVVLRYRIGSTLLKESTTASRFSRVADTLVLDAPIQYAPNTLVLDAPIQYATDKSYNYVSRHFGNDIKWRNVHSALWHKITDSEDHSITLTDVDDMVSSTSTTADDVLAVIGLLASNDANILRIEYSVATESSDYSVSQDDVNSYLFKWWGNKSLTDEQWYDWATHVIVKWRPCQSMETHHETQQYL